MIRELKAENDRLKALIGDSNGISNNQDGNKNNFFHYSILKCKLYSI
jgi:hypothetical protein